MTAADTLRRRAYAPDHHPGWPYLVLTLAEARALADLLDAAQGMYEWLAEECLPPDAEYAAEGHLFSMSGDDLGHGRAVEEAGRDALAAVEAAFGEGRGS